MLPSSLDQEFIQHLHEEKGRAQETRGKLVLQKLAFGTALLGLGAINFEVGKVSTSYAILLTPLVALVFDFYIMGEDYGIKRIGYYLQTHSSSRVEKEWEHFVSAHRDPFAPWAMPALTALLTAGAAMLAWTLIASLNTIILVTWLAACVSISFGTFIWYSTLRRKIQAIEPAQPAQDRRLARKMSALRRLIEQENHLLSEKSYRGIKDLFMDVTARIPYHDRRQLLSREYETKEFLACVDENGMKTGALPQACADFRHAAQTMPEIKEWFQEGLTPEGQAALLPARWLCHALGLRHGTAHLVLTSADERQDVLVQVRCMGKIEAPGCFDLPVAGHVDGLQSYAQTLRKEAVEELALDVDRLIGLEETGGYAQSNRSSDGQMFNAEYHRVYTAQIRPEDIIRLKPAVEEVAAILLLPPGELERMMTAYPTQFASGIVDTLKAFPLK